MKGFLIISMLFGAALAATMMPDDTTTDMVLGKVQEMKSIIRTTAQEIVALASADNPEVGERIKIKFQEMKNKTGHITEKIKEVKDDASKLRSLIKEKRGEIVAKFLDGLSQTKEAVKDDISLLKPETKKQISTKFHDSLKQLKELAKEIKDEIQAE